MAKNQINPEELESVDLEDVLASADFDLPDDEESEDVEETETTEEGEEETEEQEGTEEAETEGEEDPELEEVLKSLDIEIKDSEPEKTSEKDEEDLELTKEEEDILAKFFENPEETLETLVEKKMEEKLAAMQAQQREVEEKWNTFLEQAEEAKEVFKDFDDIMNEGVLEKLSQDPQNAAVVMNAPNIAEAAYYYAKFGTPIPSAKQLATLGITANEGEKETPAKEAPEPVKGKAVTPPDENAVPDSLEVADLDF